MKFKMIHENLNVSDLEKSIRFYNEALGLYEVRRKTSDDFIIVYLKSEVGEFELELTWLKDHPQPYDLGECEFHLAFWADDFEAAHKKHKEMLKRSQKRNSPRKRRNKPPPMLPHRKCLMTKLNTKNG